MWWGEWCFIWGGGGSGWGWGAQLGGGGGSFSRGQGGNVEMGGSSKGAEVQKLGRERLHDLINLS